MMSRSVFYINVIDSNRTKSHKETGQGSLDSSLHIESILDLHVTNIYTCHQNREQHTVKQLHSGEQSV